MALITQLEVLKNCPENDNVLASTDEHIRDTKGQNREPHTVILKVALLSAVIRGVTLIGNTVAQKQQ